MNSAKSLLKISIVTPSFNQGMFLEETINSILDQNYPNLEYIIIDGGSKDNSVEIIRKYSKHLSYWVSEKDSGQCEAINKGFKKCSGDIFNWVNSDDKLFPGSLLKISAAFEDPNVKLVYGKCIKEGEGYGKRVLPSEPIPSSIEELLFDMHFIQPAVFLRKSTIDQIGMLNESLHFRLDYEWYFRFILFHGKDGLKSLDDEIAFARIHSLSKTFSLLEGFNDESLLIWNSFCRQFQAPETLMQILKKAGAKTVPEFHWTVNPKLNKEKIFSIVEQKVAPLAEDGSRKYRDMCDYLAYFGDRKAVVVSAWKAFQVSPLRLINMKYLLRSLLRSLN